MVEHASHCPKLPWMIDFHSSAEGTIPNSQLKAAFADNWIEHLSELNIQSQIPRRRLTGILCTIGPSCNTIEILERMMRAGMTVARFKMAYFSHEECTEAIKLLRKANDNYSKSIGRIYPLAIALDLRGPEIRTGSLKDVEAKELELVEGNVTVLTSDPAYEEHVTENMIFVDYQKISEVIEPGDHIYLDDGKVTLSALEIVGSTIRCLIERVFGAIGSSARLSLPGIPTDLPALSEKDIEDLSFAIEHNIDVVIASCTKDVDTLDSIRENLGEAGKHIMIISKIENCQGIDYFDEILNLSDGIMVSRNSLTIEVPQEKLFLIQKCMIAKCNKVGKPVICGSLMLESMINHSQPNRSEICDIANTVLDGVDCLALSKETTIGEYPVETIEMLSTICKEAEAAVYQRQIFRDLSEKILSPIEPVYAISIAAVEASMKCNAAAIILCTTTGRSAKLITQYRPRCPIIALTRYSHVARQLHLFRNIDPILYIKPLKGDWHKDVENRIQLGITYGKVTGFIRTGDALIIVTGARQGSGFTNAMKIVYASAFDALPPEAENKIKNEGVGKNGTNGKHKNGNSKKK